DSTTQYGLTGAVFARDRSAIEAAEKGLRHAAGNFYVNSKSSGPTRRVTKVLVLH
ncbi:delta-1-pyrroline-5-carboxylate dehydrogenase, partial [Colletotrichum abscissum]|uniref:delta-1-pyrroline-5-carboxylate dehydrogenase n=1 Tax=Colletotrichum abscissum TaxID=1671311 RepID=UPI0027D4AAB0